MDRVLARAERRPFLALVALCLVLWLPGFFTLPAGDRDESRFAQATKQMIETGDAVQIRNGLVSRNQKPIGIYWLQLPFAAAARAAHLATGNPIWPYRLPSLIGGMVAVFATFGFGEALVGRKAALLGAAFLASSVILTVEVHIAKTDAALLAATVLVMGALSRAWLDPAAVRWPIALLFWGALGLGILIKGPIAPMVVGLAALWLVVLGGRHGQAGERWRWLWVLRPKQGVWLTLAIVLPWFVAIGLATHGQFFSQSVGGDLAGKLAGSDDAHGGPPGLHLLLLPLLLFAGGVAAVCAVPSVWRERRLPGTRFLIAWIVPSWVVFELVATKLPHYTLPLYPAVALLAGRWMLQPAIGRASWVGASLAVGVVTVLGVAALALPEVALPGLNALDLLGVPTAIVAAVLVMPLLRVWPDPRRATLLMLCGAPFLYGILLGVELPWLSPLWIAPRVATVLAQIWPHGRPSDAAFAELGFAEPSLMFLCGTGTQLMGDPAEAVRFLMSGRDRVLAVGDRDLAPFQVRALAAGLSPRLLGTVAGYNYSRGRQIVLSLFGSPDQGPVKE